MSSKIFRNKKTEQAMEIDGPVPVDAREEMTSTYAHPFKWNILKIRYFTVSSIFFNFE